MPRRRAVILPGTAAGCRCCRRRGAGRSYGGGRRGAVAAAGGGGMAAPCWAAAARRGEQLRRFGHQRPCDRGGSAGAGSVRAVVGGGQGCCSVIGVGAEGG